MIFHGMMYRPDHRHLIHDLRRLRQFLTYLNAVRTGGIGLNGPRMLLGASGFMSNMSIWLAAILNRKITDLPGVRPLVAFSTARTIAEQPAIPARPLSAEFGDLNSTLPRNKLFRVQQRPHNILPSSRSRLFLSKILHLFHSPALVHGK